MPKLKNSMRHFKSFWYFPPIFDLLKVTRLVILFDLKLQDFKNSPKLTIFGIFKELLSTQTLNLARFVRNIDLDFFCNFQTPCHCSLFLERLENEKVPWRRQNHFSDYKIHCFSLRQSILCCRTGSSRERKLRESRGRRRNLLLKWFACK